MEAFRACFSIIPDPRAMNAQHDLMEILFIALASGLCGGTTCCDMAAFGRSKLDMLREILPLPHGIPSHDTFSAVLARLDPDAINKAFARFMAAFHKELPQEKIIAIDGKALRRGFVKGQRATPPMLVTAWGSELRMILNSKEVTEGGETAAALELLQLIDVKGSMVTADALHCTRPMAEAILERGGDYVLALKGNQMALLRDVETLFAEAPRDAMPCARTEETGHGRTETRWATVLATPQLTTKHGFRNLTAVGRIESIRTMNGVDETATRFFILSRILKPTQLLHMVRAHWVLDVVLDEDLARNRKNHSAANLAFLRRLTLNILRAEPSKSSLRLKTKRAGWENSFLLSLLSHMR